MWCIIGSSDKRRPPCCCCCHDSGAAGCDNNINRHDESRNSLRSLGCQQIFSPVLNKGKCFLKQEVIQDKGKC